MASWNTHLLYVRYILIHAPSGTCIQGCKHTVTYVLNTVWVSSFSYSLVRKMALAFWSNISFIQTNCWNGIPSKQIQYIAVIYPRQNSLSQLASILYLFVFLYHWVYWKVHIFVDLEGYGLSILLYDKVRWFIEELKHHLAQSRPW